jgi:oxygen-independent coproporphyrinogen-3 oxidase
MNLGVYIQVPFCQTKCTYCNFHTGVVSRHRYQPYASAICREIEQEARNSEVWEGGVLTPPLATNDPGALAPEVNTSVDTVYFGGGTPSLLAPDSLAQTLHALRSRYEFVAPEIILEADDASRIVILSEQRERRTSLSRPEITLEADPETITPEKAASWLAAGFNRISLGVQSFNDRELQATGRMHRRAGIAPATEILRAAGIDNIGMDLIIGLPYQSSESWEQSVSELLALRSEHISIYMMEIDEGSHLGKESLAGGTRYSAAAIPRDDTQAEFYESACARLAAAGYDHYEISNWALPGRRSRHNLKYWQREPYLGFGAGAHSFDGRTRWANVHDSARYVAMIEQRISPREQVEPITPEQSLEEEFFLGLRQLDGIDLARIERDYASPSTNGARARFAAIRRQIESLRAQGLLELQGSHLRLAPNSLTVSSSILAELLT